MFPPEVVFCQVAGGTGQASHMSPPLSLSNYLPQFFVFQRVDWILIHRFVDRTRIHLKPSGGSLKTVFIVFHGGCQTGFRQCERQGTCISTGGFRGGLRGFHVPTGLALFEGDVCVETVRSSWKGFTATTKVAIS